MSDTAVDAPAPLRKHEGTPSSSTERTTIVLAFWLIVLVGLPFWWTTTSIERHALPQRDVADLVKQQVSFHPMTSSSEISSSLTALPASSSHPSRARFAFRTSGERQATATTARQQLRGLAMPSLQGRRCVFPTCFAVLALNPTYRWRRKAATHQGRRCHIRATRETTHAAHLDLGRRSPSSKVQLAIQARLQPALSGRFRHGYSARLGCRGGSGARVPSLRLVTSLADPPAQDTSCPSLMLSRHFTTLPSRRRFSTLRLYRSSQSSTKGVRSSRRISSRRSSTRRNGAWVRHRLCSLVASALITSHSLDCLTRSSSALSALCAL